MQMGRAGEAARCRAGEGESLIGNFSDARRTALAAHTLGSQLGAARAVKNRLKLT